MLSLQQEHGTTILELSRQLQLSCSCGLMNGNPVQPSGSKYPHMKHIPQGYHASYRNHRYSTSIGLLFLIQKAKFSIFGYFEPLPFLMQKPNTLHILVLRTITIPDTCTETKDTPYLSNYFEPLPSVLQESLEDSTVPKGPYSLTVDTQALKQGYRSPFKAQVYTILAHGGLWFGTLDRWASKPPFSVSGFGTMLPCKPEGRERRGG